MPTDPTKPNPKNHWLKELLLDLSPGLGEVRSGRQAVEDFSSGRYGWGAVNALGAIPLLGMAGRAGKAVKALSRVERVAEAAKLARAAELVKDIEKAGGVTLDLATGEKVTRGFSVGGATKTKKLKKLTPKALVEYMDKAPEGTALGAWFDDGMWHLDHANIVDDADEAIRMGIVRGEDSIGDLGKYANNQNGTIRILKHRTNADLSGGVFDPKFMGSGMAGAEKARPGRPGSIHFYGRQGKVEDMFQGTKEYYSAIPDADLLDLGSDEARALMKQAGGDADKLERLVMKKGYRGVKQATDPDIKTPYARIYKVFDKLPVIDPKKATPKVPEAFSSATRAVEAKAGRAAPPSSRFFDESVLDRPIRPPEGVPQVELPFRGTRAKEPPAVLDELISNFRTKYTPLVERNLIDNPRQAMWYELGDMPSRWAGAGGDADFMLRAIPPTSTGTNVRKNLELASYYHALWKRGLISEEALKGHLELLQGYSNRRQKDINRGLLDILTGIREGTPLHLGGGLDPLEAQKTARFGGNIGGNWTPGTLDLQVGKVVGKEGLREVVVEEGGKKVKKLVPGRGYPKNASGSLVTTSPLKQHYPWLEQLGLRPEAKRLGLPEAAYQAAGWPGQDSRPLLVIMNDLMEEGARARGVGQNEFFDMLARGDAIWGPGAAGWR